MATAGRSRPFLSRHFLRQIRADHIETPSVADQGRSYRDIFRWPLKAVPIETLLLAAQGGSYRDTFCGRSGPFLSRHLFWLLGAVPIETHLWPLRTCGHIFWTYFVDKNNSWTQFADSFYGHTLRGPTSWPRASSPLSIARPLAGWEFRSHFGSSPEPSRLESIPEKKCRSVSAKVGSHLPLPR